MALGGAFVCMCMSKYFHIIYLCIWFVFYLTSNKFNVYMHVIMHSKWNTIIVKMR